MIDDFSEQLKSEIEELRGLVKAQADEIASIRLSARRANTMIDAIKDVVYDLTSKISNAHEKVNSVLYTNPKIVEDICRLEEILGPADQPTPRAPPRS